jgi:act minimal PKS acyl carrier protein
MAADAFTIEDLKSTLRDAAGEATDLDADILDVPFDELGYDSLALLETGGRIQRERGIVLADSTLVEAGTPRALLAAVNEQLTTAAA